MRSFSLFLLFLLHGISLVAQPVFTDSLRKDYEQEQNDSLKISKQLSYISYLLKDYGNEHAVRTELDAVWKRIEKKPVPLFISRYYHYEGFLFYSQNNYLQSIISYEKGLRYKEYLLNTDAKSIGQIYTSLGLSYSMINDWENAQQNYQKAIDTYELINDSSGISLAYMNMAYIFSDVEDWENTVVNLRKADKYIGITPGSEYQGMIYSSLGQALSRLGLLKEAETYLAMSKRDISKTDPDRDHTFYFIGLGEYYFNAGKYAEALSAHLKSLDYARAWGDSAFVAEALENTGRVYGVLKNYKAATAYLLQSKAITEKYNYLPQRKITLKQLLELSGEQKNYKEAALYASELLNVSDSLFRTQNNNKRIIMDAVYESGKKEKLINSLQQETEIQQLKIRQKSFLNYILIGSAATILIILLLSFRTYKQKQKLQQQRINELETEKKLMATEAVLKGEEQERTRLARDLHDGLGGMLSGIKYSFNAMKGNLIMTPENALAFERSMDMLDSSIQEMRRVAHNMMPEALVKFGLDTALKDFCNDINKSGALHVNYQSIGMENAVIDQTTAITIYRVVQELINNTMKHAAAKTAIVQVSKAGGEISMTVEDDGRGFDTDILRSVRGGIGWSNIQSRVEYLKGKLDVKSEPGKGTSVHIELNT